MLATLRVVMMVSLLETGYKLLSNLTWQEGGSFL